MRLSLLVSMFFFVFPLWSADFRCETLLAGSGFDQELAEILQQNQALVVSRDQAEHLRVKYGFANVQDLMNAIIKPTRNFARPTVSNYLVSAVGLELETGDLVIGVNLEFAGHALNQTVHGEQFVLTRIYTRGNQLLDLAISAEPCGHCRQWLNEAATADRLRIFLPRHADGSVRAPIRFRDLLPAPFGPDVLGQSGLLPHPPSSTFQIEGPWTITDRKLKAGYSLPRRVEFTNLRNQAIEAARLSYAPYTGNESGVALLMKSGRIITGSYIENVAFNPSLSPLQAALVNLVANGLEYQEIVAAVMVESSNSKSSQRFAMASVMATVAPQAEWIALAH